MSALIHMKLSMAAVEGEFFEDHLDEDLHEA